MIMVAVQRPLLQEASTQESQTILGYTLGSGRPGYWKICSKNSDVFTLSLLGVSSDRRTTLVTMFPPPANMTWMNENLAYGCSKFSFIAQRMIWEIVCVIQIPLVPS